ncbi:2-hydroxyacid dehydrogenase [Chthonobacter rhizosphaerae]|uniref:2-hydroxyacid dehydrogenase n=1 Tax=Chthonobacter rhizosphaerae TaxID=2735553 RepID=UPI0015EFD838|nr:2-hydroxyacid dehydrogenase [Chthonobacter rhizosphaerae]
MDVAVFNTKPYDRRYLEAANADGRHGLLFLEPHLSPETALLAKGHAAVCVFVNDRLDAPVLERLNDGGVSLIALRCAGFNNVDLAAAKALGLTVARVPAYSPHAVAEHTIALMLTLNRRIHRAYNRVREGNFALDGLIGFDLHGKTAGVVGTGKIGALVAGILKGFGCRVIAYDARRDPACEAAGVAYVDFPTLCRESDVITLHCPLTPDTHHLIDAEAIAAMKRGVMLVNTSRGAVVDTAAVLKGLKSGMIGAVALDVYEEEGDFFFEDLSNRYIGDDLFARLLTFPNVLITGHQAFLTHEALTAIAETTIGNITAFETTGRALHPVSVEKVG